MNCVTVQVEVATKLFMITGGFNLIRGPPFSTYAPRGGWVGSSLLYITIAYYMQKGGGWVQIARKIAYVLNGRPLNIVIHTLNAVHEVLPQCAAALQCQTFGFSARAGNPLQHC